MKPIRCDMIHELRFTPLPFLKSGDAQTILASFGFPVFDPTPENRMIALKDGTVLCCPVMIPDGWKEEKGIIILLHGLGGSAQSHYMRRISAKLFRMGYFVFCLNRRGCGCGKGFAPCLGHGGKTDDLMFVLQQIREQYPIAPLRMIGFSIGGNLLLKLLGELENEGKEYLRHCIAVSPLVDLKDATETLGKPSNRIYERFFVNGLIELVRAAERAFPVEKVEFPPNCSMLEYDELYTAPKWGYQNAGQYYAENSATNVVSKIRVPCDVLCAEDDPFIRYETLESLEVPSCVNIWKTEHGGHMGFLGYTGGLSIRWMDQKIISWIEKDF